MAYCTATGWGELKSSPEAEFVLQTPAAPETAKAVGYTGKISVSWSAVDGAEKYHLQRRVYRNGEWSSWTNIDTKLTTTSYADKDVTKDIKYQYRVRAYNAAGWGSFTVTAGAKER